MNRIVILLLLTVSVWPCNGQSIHAGIYSRAEDLINNRLENKLNCDSGKVRVSLGKMIIVHQKKITHSFTYTEVYGYCNCDKKALRIWNRKEYEIINTEEIILYKTEHIVSKSSELEPDYFFSVTLSSSLLPLTIQNLKTAYSGSHQLNDLLDERFKNDEQLIRFNKSLRKFELVHVFIDAKKE